MIMRRNKRKMFAATIGLSQTCQFPEVKGTFRSITSRRALQQTDKLALGLDVNLIR